MYLSGQAKNGNIVAGNKRTGFGKYRAVAGDYSPRHRFARRPSLRLRRKEGCVIIIKNPKTLFAVYGREGGPA
ncbi:MAG: hypothetical protein JWR50_815 [Mucilaginibacter sp.]|nr:hypothetical protein [Mucilaginibacter sp.]